MRARSALHLLLFVVIAANGDEPYSHLLRTDDDAGQPRLHWSPLLSPPGSELPVPAALAGSADPSLVPPILHRSHRYEPSAIEHETLKHRRLRRNLLSCEVGRNHLMGWG